jgi:ATP phosphoribosyltransferase
MNTWLNIALPKGRLGEQAMLLLNRTGYGIPNLPENDRRLILENPVKKIRFFWVKPIDVPIYVARGAADLGIAGKDVILEQASEVYEMLDLKFGVCRMVLAAPKGWSDQGTRILRIATKYPGLTTRYFAAKHRQVEIIALSGSIELAPVVGLADAIVDLVETGSTLRANGLEEIEILEQISARLIVNPVAFRYQGERIQEIREQLQNLDQAEQRG